MGDLQHKLNKVREREGQEKDHMGELYKRPGHKVRMTLVRGVLAKHVSGKKFLDIGCAEGIYCNLARLFGAKHTMGIDVSESKIKRATEKFPLSTFAVKDCMNLTDYYDQYDVVLCSEVLQHVDDYEALVEEMRKCLKIGGILIITIPNLASGEYIRAEIDEDMEVEELLNEVGGAGFGRQHAVWKFDSSLFAREYDGVNGLKLRNMIPVDTPDGEKKNLWTIIVYEHTDILPKFTYASPIDEVEYTEEEYDTPEEFLDSLDDEE